MENRVLVGQKEISSYVRREWRTVEKLIENKKFPAKKINGVWMSQPALIDVWLQEVIELADAASR